MDPATLASTDYVCLNIPSQVARAINIDDKVVATYINPTNNTDFVVFEDSQTIFNIECYSDVKRATEADSAVAHVGGCRGRKRQLPINDRHRQANEAKEPPFKKEPRFNRTYDWPSDIDWDDGHMCFDTFARHCLSRCAKDDDQTIDLLREIYALLDGYVITDKVLSVVVSTVRRISNRNIRNTTRQAGEKLDKKSKKQLRYLLNGIADKRLTTICM